MINSTKIANNSGFKKLAYAKHQKSKINWKTIISYDIDFVNPLFEDDFLDIFAYIQSLWVTPMFFCEWEEVRLDSLEEFEWESSFSCDEDTFFALTKYMKFEKIKENLSIKAKNQKNKTQDEICYLLKKQS